LSGLAGTGSTTGSNTTRGAPLKTKKKVVSTTPDTEMRSCYERGDLPVTVLQTSTHPSGGSLLWEVEPSLLDYETYLPMFFGGLVETEEPHALFARRGIVDMVQHGDDESIAEAVPRCIKPIRTALETEDQAICVTTIESVQALLRAGPLTAKAVLPGCKQILPCFRRLLLAAEGASSNEHRDNELDSIVRGTVNLSTIIEETLALLNRVGGQEAYDTIKSLVPLYAGII
jgi:hypothetical protein